MTQKLCLFCKHFKYGLSTRRQRNPEYFKCLKARVLHEGLFGQYPFDEPYRPVDEAELRTLMLTAETCPDYEEINDHS